jgi:hypothetical protein
MGLLDDVLGSAVPGGNLAKPLMVGLAALLGARAVGGGLGNLLGGAGASAQTPSTAAPTGPASASPPQGVFWAASVACCRAFNRAGTVMSSIPGSGLGRTNRLRQISCTEPSVPTRSITCLA